jgi:hypothetical protein
MTRDPVPSAPTENPSTRNPVAVIARIADIVARDPHVPASVPVPVSWVPNIMTSRRRRNGLNYSRRRGDSDDDLRSCRPVRREEGAPGK